MGDIKKAMQAQKRISELNKKLAENKVVSEENGVKVTAKLCLPMQNMYEIESIEIDGVELKAFNKAMKTVKKDAMKSMQKLIKSGEINLSEIGGM